MVALVVATNVVSVWVTLQIMQEPNELHEVVDDPRVRAESRVVTSGDSGQEELAAAATVSTQDLAADYKERLLSATVNDEYVFLARKYVENLSAEEARDAIPDWLADENGLRSSAVLTQLYNKWAELDPYAATYSAFESLKEVGGMQGSRLLEGPLSRLGIERADQAVEFINEKLLKGDSRVSIFGLSLGTVSKELIERGDYGSLDIWIQQFDRMKNRSESRMMTYRFSDGVGLGLKEASANEVDRVLGLFPEGDIKNRAISGFVRHAEGISGVELADWSLQQDLESVEKDRVLASAIRNWAKKEGGFEDAFSYVSELESGITLDNSLSALYYTSPKDDYETRFELMNTIGDSKVRDRVAANFASSATDLDTESRLSVAMSIKNKSSRTRSIERLLLEVAVDNVDQAFEQLDGISSDLLDAKNAADIREKLEHERKSIPASAR